MTIANQERETATYRLTFSAQEMDYLEGILKTDLGNTRVEFRRTDLPTFQEHVLLEEDIIRGC
jgi:hypothetical protein